jgi:MFS family permease
LVVGVAGVTSFIIALLSLKDIKSITAYPAKTKLTTRQLLRGWLDVARNKGALTISFVQAIQYYVFGVVEFYFVQYMTQIAVLNALQIGIVMTAQLVSLIVSRPLMGRFSDKTSRRIPIIIGCFISAALLFVIPFTTSFTILIIISIGYGLGFAMAISSTAPIMCEATADTPVGTSMGFLSTMMDIGQAIGPIISGVILATVLQYNGLFTSLTVLLLASAGIFFFSGIAKTRTEQ